jgi:hypothetical protein
MNEVRLAEIEQMAESMEVSARDENIIMELIQALRDERQKVAELKSKIKRKNQILYKGLTVYNELPLEIRQSDKTIVFITTAFME